MAAKLEYIWLDGYKPTQSLRRKKKIQKERSKKYDNAHTTYICCKGGKIARRFRVVDVDKEDRRT